MSEYRASNGTSFDDEDIEAWAATQESESGYRGAHLGPAVPGRPVSVGVGARPFTIRLDAERRARLTKAAHDRRVTPSQLMRDLIDTL